VTIDEGRITSGQFPFVIITSNAEREFPAPFLRRCVRLNIEPPDTNELSMIVKSHLKQFADTLNDSEVDGLIGEFDRRRKENQEVATDQLLNAIFLTVAMQDSQGRSFRRDELETLRENLFRQLSGPAA
jgi:MoxR-like ATPase